MEKLTPRERFMVWLRLACACFCLLASISFLVIRVYAQPRAVMPTITVEDARQDMRLDELKEFKDNQESYNREQGTVRKTWEDEQGKRIGDLENKAAAIEGIGGCVGVILSIFNVLFGIAHFKKPAETE
jgi:hypothetical protein